MESGNENVFLLPTPFRLTSPETVYKRYSMPMKKLSPTLIIRLKVAKFRNKMNKCLILTIVSILSTAHFVSFQLHSTDFPFLSVK